MVFAPQLATAPQAYDARIDTQQTGRGWSLFGCQIEDYVITGQDPVSLKARTVKVSLYRAQREDMKAAAVIILPPTGGVNIIDRGYANQICSSGMTVALVSSWEHQGESSLDFSMHNNGALRALAATRHVVEFLRSKEFQSIGVLGTSIGAIAGALAFGIEPRILATALIVGSARFADVVAESDEAGARRLRRERMKHFGYHSAEEYREALRSAVYMEPGRWFGNVTGRKALVVSADADTTVPSEYQFELAAALNAQHIRLRGGHLQGVKDAFCSHRGEITAFFNKALRNQ